jgi:Tfp pilus assembly protein PilV
MKLASPKRNLAGTTLVETMVAVLLVAGSFGSVFELNSVCLHYVSASRNDVAVVQGIQDRIESLRNLTFSNLTTATTVQTLMASPPNTQEFLKRGPAEVVTLSAYPTPDASNTKITRAAGANLATINTTDASLSNATMVKVNVTFTWTEPFGGRARSEQSETIIANGNKKA